MAFIGGIFSDYLNQSWEESRGLIREELEQLKSALRKIQIFAFPNTWATGTLYIEYPSDYLPLEVTEHFFVNSAEAFGECVHHDTSMPLVVPPVGGVLTCHTAAVTDLPTNASHTFTIDVGIEVSNMTGTQIFRASWSKILNAGKSGNINFRLESPSTDAIMGSDLSWDSGTSSIVSTAGGTFMARISWALHY